MTTHPLVKALNDATQRTVRHQAADWLLATVTATGTGVVSITTATGPVANVRRLKAYTPTVGDTVMVTRNASGNWLVIGALA